MKIVVYEDDQECAELWAALLTMLYPSVEVVMDLGQKSLLCYCDDPSYDIILSDFTVLRESALSWLEANYDPRVIFVSGYQGDESGRVNKKYVWLPKGFVEKVQEFLSHRIRLLEMAKDSLKSTLDNAA